MRFADSLALDVQFVKGLVSLMYRICELLLIGAALLQPPGELLLLIERALKLRRDFRQLVPGRFLLGPQLGADALELFDQNLAVGNCCGELAFGFRQPLLETQLVLQGGLEPVQRRHIAGRDQHRFDAVRMVAEGDGLEQDVFALAARSQLAFDRTSFSGPDAIHEFAPGCQLVWQDMLFERSIQNVYMSRFAQEPEARIVASQQGAGPSDTKQAKWLFLDDRPEVCRFAGFC